MSAALSRDENPESSAADITGARSGESLADRQRQVRSRLAGHLFALATGLGLAGAGLLYIPALVYQHEQQLNMQVSAAHAFESALTQSPKGLPPTEHEPAAEITAALAIIGVRGLVLVGRDGRQQVIGAASPPTEPLDLQGALGPRIRAAFETLGRQRRNLLMRAKTFDGEIEILADRSGLQRALRAFSLIFWLAAGSGILIIATGVAALAHARLGKGLDRLVARLNEFAARPQEIPATGEPNRGGELAAAETALANVQNALANELRNRDRLTGIGLAVTKISHDLRNILTSAQLLADRLGDATDPGVRRIGPRLTGILERAIRFTQAIATYGGASERPARLELLALRDIVNAVTETVAADARAVEIQNQVGETFVIRADADQMFRLLLNLVNNGVEALQRMDKIHAPKAEIRISAKTEERHAVILVCDSGPGVPDILRPKLFDPFFNAPRPGSPGFGLAIAYELARAQGGNLSLQPSGTGTTFRLVLPLPARTTAVEKH
jgi:signal transduction histidine kinase